MEEGVEKGMEEVDIEERSDEPLESRETKLPVEVQGKIER